MLEVKLTQEYDQVMTDDMDDLLADDSSDNEVLLTPDGSVGHLEQVSSESIEVIGYDDLELAVYQCQGRDGILVSIKPPKEPARLDGKLKHVPCDIVLTIDVSASMTAKAPPPMSKTGHIEHEHNNLTVLDLVKHAARTILESLDETDRLAIVTFSTQAKIVQPLWPMTAENKSRALRNIQALQTENLTNLWHGIVQSIKVFQGDERSACVPAILVLTDGKPNYMCPGQGYVQQIRSYQLPASLHTFGFGYALQSDLLKSISDIGGGNYAFIPDSGMLGTVFIHAIANLQTTFATNASLTITAPGEIILMEGACNNTIKSSPHKYESLEEIAETARSENKRRTHSTPGTREVVMDFHTIHYGQSREAFIPHLKLPLKVHTSHFRLSLTARRFDGSVIRVSKMQRLITDMATSDLAFHRARSEICEFIRSLFPLNSLEQYQGPEEISPTELCSQIESLASMIASCLEAHPTMKPLWEDLVGRDPSGQVRLAVSSQEYYKRWGRHYLLSILTAHERQICNSFKDSGPLLYGKHSPLFLQCRDALNRAFDDVPPPIPGVDMTRYHDPSAECFAGHCKIALGNGNLLAVELLKPGMSVRTMLGQARIAAVVRMKVCDLEMRQTGGLVITPFHPICRAGVWRFPIDEADIGLFYNGDIFSVMLERDPRPEMHTVDVEGCWVVTLGHGIRSVEDVRSHDFFGDYEAVEESLSHLTKIESGVLVCQGAARDPKSGLVCGFL